jgi:hypothetical protein
MGRMHSGCAEPHSVAPRTRRRPVCPAPRTRGSRHPGRRPLRVDGPPPKQGDDAGRGACAAWAHPYAQALIGRLVGPPRRSTRARVEFTSGLIYCL